MELMPEYKQTEVGVVPKDWKVEPVGEAFEVCDFLRLPISQDVRKTMVGQYPYYGPTSIQGFINEYRVEGEFALIGEDGDHFLKWRNTTMTLLVRGRFNVNNHAHIVKGTKNLTSWFYYYFSHKDLTQYLTRQGAGRYKLTKSALIDIPCVLPPLPEQRAIAAALSDTDALLSSLNQLLAKKRDIKQAAMQQLLTGKQRLPGFSGEWKMKDIKELVQIPVTDGPHTTPQFLDDGVPFLSVNNLVDNKINLDQLRYISPSDHELFSRKCRPVRDDILFGKAASVGKVALVDFDREFNIWSPIALIRLTPNDSPRFFYYSLQSYEVVKQITLLTNSSSQGNLGMGDIERIRLPVPSLPEQVAIAAVLSDMDAEIDALQQRRDKTRAIKQGMMQELLTGRTRLV